MLNRYRFNILFKNTTETITIRATESHPGEADKWRAIISKMRLFEYNIDECDCHRQHIMHIDESYIDLSAVVLISMTEMVKE